MPVSTPSAAYLARIDTVTTTRDACAGQHAVKAGGRKYLPAFIPDDPERYEQYLKRAVYTNVVGRTLDGLLGLAFRKEPTFTLPAELDYMSDDADGQGLSLEQVSKIIVGELLQAGRVGLLVDYPEADPGLSVEDVRMLGLSATVAVYASESIINWSDDGRLIVLRETVEERSGADEFHAETKYRYRVLSLDEGGYVQRVFDEGGQVVGRKEPRGADGRRLKTIPFVWVGAETNTASIDLPPLYDLAELNIAHYRNSADQEESLFIHGQGTLFVSSEMTADQFNVANPNGIVVGARRGHFLGKGGSAQLLQTAPNDALSVAMQAKLDQMLALGAQIITPKTGVETAEAARIRSASEASVLSTVVANASEAIEAACEYATLFMGGNADDVTFEINRDFFDRTLTAQDVMALIQLADRGDVAQTDLRDTLRQAGWLKGSRTDDEIDAEAEQQGPRLDNDRRDGQ